MEDRIELCKVNEVIEVVYQEGFKVGYEAARLVISMMEEQEKTTPDGYFMACDCLEAINKAERRAYELYGRQGLPRLEKTPIAPGPTRNQ